MICSHSIPLITVLSLMKIGGDNCIDLMIVCLTLGDTCSVYTVRSVLFVQIVALKCDVIKITVIDYGVTPIR